MKLLIKQAVVLASVATLSVAATDGDAASHRSQKSRPGVLATYPLIYRDAPKYVGGGYIMIFRTRGSFTTTSGDPGRIEASDSVGLKADFAGVLSHGRPAGRCYWWSMPRTPKLDRVKSGSHVHVTLRLKGTPTQRGVITLRTIEHGLPASAWTTKGKVARDLKRIGCSGRVVAG